jgi:hypothetical protein
MPIPTAVHRWAGPALLILLGLGQAACDFGHACSGGGLESRATFRLHLPPAADVTAPETVTACQVPTCTTATVPPIAETGTLSPLQFSDPDVTGNESLASGNVRVLDLAWTLTNVLPADPRNEYQITVTDAAGVVTGKLSQLVTYTKTADSDCGPGQWEGPLTSD